MTPPNLTGSALAAWHRSEADRIEAEEQARRPALAAGQVWKDPATGSEWIACVNDLLVNPWSGVFWCGDRSSLEYVGLARDVLRVVPPDSEEIRYSGPDTPITVQIAPHVAPEPTGAELVGRLCWVKLEGKTGWRGPGVIEKYDGSSMAFRVESRIDGLFWFTHAKPYIEGVAP